MTHGYDIVDDAPVARRADKPPQRQKRRFKLVSFTELVPSKEPSYRIKGLLPRVGVAVIWGPPKSGKSFVATDICLHIALGWTYRSRMVLQGTVVYCALESEHGYGNRAEAFQRRKLAEYGAHVPFYLVGGPISFFKDHETLIADIREQLPPGIMPAVVVLDTLNRSLDGSENDDEDMGRYIRACDAISAAFGCLVVIVHHCGIDGTRPRGHTSLQGAADAQLAVRRDAAGNITMTVEWLKDGPEGEVVVSRTRYRRGRGRFRTVRILQVASSSLSARRQKPAQPRE